MSRFRYKHGDRPIDGYTIERAVGRGGFGEVYYAVSDSGRQVALKALLQNQDIEMRGLAECMNLKSPHLVSIFDVKENEEGDPFVLMEFISGPSLREILDDHPEGLGAAKTAFLTREIAKGLAYLHDRGIVHRDLKPHNIFFEEGYVKIGDYSLSKAISTTHYTAHTISVGTVHYMAPEVGKGVYDRGIDIYALGAIIYEMLKGVPPYNGQSPAEILLKHVTATPDCTDIDAPWAAIIGKAMAKDPAQRYQHVDELTRDLLGARQVQDTLMGFRPESLTLAGKRAEREMGNPVAAVRSRPGEEPLGIKSGPGRLNRAAKDETNADRFAPKAVLAGASDRHKGEIQPQSRTRRLGSLGGVILFVMAILVTVLIAGLLVLSGTSPTISHHYARYTPHQQAVAAISKSWQDPVKDPLSTFRLKVDKVGTFLVFRAPRLQIRSVDSLQHADLRIFSGMSDTYCIVLSRETNQLSFTHIYGGSASPSSAASNGDSIQCSPSCWIRLWQPDRKKCVARLEIVGEPLPGVDTNQAIFMEDELTFGPDKGAPIIATHLSGPITLRFRYGRVYFETLEKGGGSTLGNIVKNDTGESVGNATAQDAIDVTEEPPGAANSKSTTTEPIDFPKYSEPISCGGLTLTFLEWPAQAEELVERSPQAPNETGEPGPQSEDQEDIETIGTPSGAASDPLLEPLNKNSK